MLARALATLRHYRKGIGALLTSVGTWGYTATRDGHISTAEWFGLLLAVGGAFGVTAVRNGPQPRPLNRAARRAKLRAVKR